MNASLEYLIDALKSLPGVGTKQAKTIAQFLINKDEIYINEFINRIKDVKKNIHFCKKCNNLTSGDICEICSNNSRDQKKLCVVVSQEELQKIESTNSYVGLYFVLNQEIDVKSKQNIEHSVIEKLINFINEKKFDEVILATNWNVNGEATALFIKKIIQQLQPNCTIYRLAVGLPINSGIDYADTTTLKHAVENKIKY